MQRFLLIINFLIIALSYSLYSQTAFIRQFPPADNGLKVNELWSLSISSVSQTPIDAIIKITVTEQTK